MEASKLYSKQFREQLADDVDAAYEAYLEDIWPPDLQKRMRRGFLEFLDWLRGVDDGAAG